MPKFFEVNDHLGVRTLINPAHIACIQEMPPQGLSQEGDEQYLRIVMVGGYIINTDISLCMDEITRLLDRLA